MSGSANIRPLENIYRSYEWLNQRVDTALLTQLGDAPGLQGIRQLCARFSATVEQVSYLTVY